MFPRTWLRSTVALAAALIASANAQDAPKAAAPKVPTLELSADLWHEDLQFFAHELPKRHANAFHHVSKEQFEAEVAALDRRLGSLNGDELYFALERIA